MHPILIKLWFIPIHSYGFLLAVSFLTAIYISSQRAERVGIDKNHIMDLGFWIILSAILGARLYYVLLHPEEFTGHWSDVFNPFGKGQVGIGGLVMFGGLFGAITAGVIFLKKKKLPVLQVADVIAPSIGIGIFFTRIGCFLNGCCYGKCTASGLGVMFPMESPAGYFQHVMHCNLLHPTQLYLSAGGLLIFCMILFLERFKRFNGSSFFLFLFLYSILRFTVEFFRHFEPNEMRWGLSHNQFFCIALFLVSTILWMVFFLRRNAVHPEPGKQNGMEKEA